MGGRGSVPRMRLTAYSDLTKIFVQPIDKETKKPTGQPVYTKTVFQAGKGMIDDLVLVGGLLFWADTGTAELYTKRKKEPGTHDRFKAAWKTLVNDCHGENVEICMGLAPQNKTGDGTAFQDWLYKSTKSDRTKMAQSIKKVLDEDLPGSSGVSFDCEYLFGPTININGKNVGKTYSQMTAAEKTQLAERRDKLADFYHQVADLISPLRIIVITGAKTGDHLTDEGVECNDHSLLHDWPAIVKDRKNVLLAAMGYMYTPRPPRNLESWHRAILRYGTAPDPSGYEEGRAHIPDEQFQLVIQVAASASDSVGITTDAETRQRGYLCRIFRNSLGLFPAKSGSYALADELLNKRPGIRPEQSKSDPADPAPPPGTAKQPFQIPIADPKVAFKKV